MDCNTRAQKIGIVFNAKTALVQRIRVKVDMHSGIGNFHDAVQVSGLL